MKILRGIAEDTECVTETKHAAERNHVKNTNHAEDTEYAKDTEKGRRDNSDAPIVARASRPLTISFFHILKNQRK